MRLFVKTIMPGAGPGMKGESNFAGRSPLRLATFSLPTHREVVAVVLSDFRFGLAPGSPRLPCVLYRVSAFHAAAN